MQDHQGLETHPPEGTQEVSPDDYMTNLIAKIGAWFNRGLLFSQLVLLCLKFFGSSIGLDVDISWLWTLSPLIFTGTTLYVTTMMCATMAVVLRKLNEDTTVTRLMVLGIAQMIEEIKPNPIHQRISVTPRDIE